jgi:hypothetical protein
MQNGDQANLGAEAFGGKDGERLRRGAHQQAIDGALVLEGDLGHRRRQGEDDVEIGNWRQLGLVGGEPLRPRRALAFWTMAVAAGVVGDAREAAIVAAFDVTPSAAVRQAAIAAVTRRSTRPRCPAFN